MIGTSVPSAEVAAGCGCAQVLDRFLFERAAEMGMVTGGAEDGSHVCLLFDTIQTVVSTRLPYLEVVKLNVVSVRTRTI